MASEKKTASKTDTGTGVVAGGGEDATKPVTPPKAAAEPSMENVSKAMPGRPQTGIKDTKPVSPAKSDSPSKPDSPSKSDSPAAASDARGPKAPLPPQPHVPQGSGGGFGAGLLGGALAVGAGIGVLWLSNPDVLRGGAAPDLAPLVTQIETREAADAILTQDLAALRSELASLPGAGASGDEIVRLRSEFAGQVEAIASEVAALASAMEVLEGRIGQVEMRPPVMAGDAGEATAKIVADMRAALDAQRAEMERLMAETQGRIEAAEAQATQLQATAEASARSAVTRSGLSRLSAALDAGGPYAAALADLEGVSGMPAPAALAAEAETGVPTMADLHRSFPDAARAALAATIRAGIGADAGAMERLGAFLKAQTGARSITPREGDDPDAVLSRAEAALAEGQLDVALALLDGLPDVGKEALADWRAAADRRAEALAAAAAYATTLAPN